MEEKDVKEEKEVKKEESKVKTATKTETKPKAEEKETKKKESKKEKNTENKNSKNGIIIACAIIAVLIVAIVIYAITMADSPKKAIETMFKEAQEEAINEAVLSSISEDDTQMQDINKVILNNLSWKILNEKQDGDKATVEIEVTNKDFKSIIDNFKEKIVKAAFSGESIDEAKTEEYLLAELNNEEIENVTNTHTIEVEKKEGKWKAELEENEIIDIILPGFNEAIESLN